MRSDVLWEPSSGRDLEGIFRVEREKVSTRLPQSVTHDGKAFRQAVNDKGYQEVVLPLLDGKISPHKLKLYIVACEFSKHVRDKACKLTKEEQGALRETLLPIFIPHHTLAKYVSVIKKTHGSRSTALGQSLITIHVLS